MPPKGLTLSKLYLMMESIQKRLDAAGPIKDSGEDGGEETEDSTDDQDAGVGAAGRRDAVDGAEEADAGDVVGGGGVGGASVKQSVSVKKREAKVRPKKSAAVVPKAEDQKAELDDGVPLTASGVAKKWTQWAAYVSGGETDAACVTRVDILINHITTAFEIARFRPAGMYDRVVRMVIDGIRAMLGAVVAEEASITSQTQAVFGALGMILTVFQRAESHSAESAAALGAAMQQPEELEEVVSRAAAGLPQVLRVPRVASEKKVRRKAEFSPFRGSAGGDGRVQGRSVLPAKRFRDGTVAPTGGGDKVGVVAKPGNGQAGGGIQRR